MNDSKLMAHDNFGTLYVVATPIGNLNDMTPRAVSILQAVQWIASEDTRHTRKLLQYFHIKTPQFALHDFNEFSQINKIVHHLKNGESIALVCDAGTPLICDAGYKIIKAIREKKIRVVPIVGACALIGALSASGLPTDRFIFEGFLPAKKIQRENYLQTVKEERRTLIFYEAPHRLLESLTSLKKIFGGDRIVCVARELTKQFETIYTDTLNHLVDYFFNHADECVGEMVLLVHGETSEMLDEKMIQAKKILFILMQEIPLKQAVKLAEKITALPKNQLYEWALEINKDT